MKENANLTKTPELTNGQFIQNLVSDNQTVTLLKSNTLSRILNEIKCIVEFEPSGESEYAEPDFNSAYIRCDELYRYGFKEVAFGQFTDIGRKINELYNHRMHGWRLFARLFTGYRIPNDLYAPENKIWPGEKVQLIEDYRFDTGCVFVTFLLKGSDEPKDVAITMDDLCEYAEACGILEQTSDSSDHTGEHTQKTRKIDLQTAIAEDEILRKLFKDYIEAGKEVFAL